MLYFVTKPNGWSYARNNGVILSVRDNKFRLAYTTFIFKGGAFKNTDAKKISGDFTSLADVIPLFEANDFIMKSGRSVVAQHFVSNIKAGTYEIGSGPKRRLILSRDKKTNDWIGIFNKTKVTICTSEKTIKFQCDGKENAASFHEGSPDVERNMLHAAQALVHVSSDMVELIRIISNGHIEWRP